MELAGVQGVCGVSIKRRQEIVSVVEGISAGAVTASLVGLAGLVASTQTVLLIGAAAVSISFMAPVYVLSRSRTAAGLAPRFLIGVAVIPLIVAALYVLGLWNSIQNAVSNSALSLAGNPGLVLLAGLVGGAVARLFILQLSGTEARQVKHAADQLLSDNEQERMGALRTIAFTRRTIGRREALEGLASFYRADLAHSAEESHLAESALRRLLRIPGEPVDFTGARLAGLDLSGANLVNATLSDVNLEGADLTEAVLASANLHRANLARATLLRVDLRGADLRHANMRGAYLAHAILDEALLERADLEGASLLGASLRGAKLRTAQFVGAIIDRVDTDQAELSPGALDRSIRIGNQLANT